MQRYLHSTDSYLGYVFDPNGNLLHRIRKNDGNTQSAPTVFVADTVLYDGFGQIRCDVDTLSGGRYPSADAVGYHGQQGLYTDVETLDFASGAYLTNFPNLSRSRGNNWRCYMVRDAVRRLSKMDSLPGEEAANEEQLAVYEKLLNEIVPPVSDEEARLPLCATIG